MLLFQLFQDKSLSDGIFFLELLSSVQPRVVNWSLVTKGVTGKNEVQVEFIMSSAKNQGYLSVASSSSVLMPVQSIDTKYNCRISIMCSILEMMTALNSFPGLMLV